MNTILVVDDDREIANAIGELLELENYKVIKTHDGKSAREILENNEIHLIILDIMMPKEDGLMATINIRKTNNIPIILLSAKSEESDKIIGLSMGADDYITKPFNSNELIARVRSLLRRYIILGDVNKVSKESTIKIAGLSLDKDTKQIYLDGEEIRFTPIEYKILEFLMSNAGIVFSAEKIYENAWGEVGYSVENTVMVHVRRIREKIEINPKEPKYLKVVWGIGYKIEKHK